MKPLLLLLLMSVHGMVDAQEPVFFDQRFQLHYNRWQSNQNATATTQATYDFNLGLPLLSYRLGAVALTGVLDYNHLSTGTESAGALGLNRYGLRATLFPYRPFHLTFDYSRNQSPGFAGRERMTGDVYGLGLNYRGTTVKDLQISFRQGNTSVGGSQEDWSTWKMAARQDVYGTHVSVEASHQDFGGSESGMRWRSSGLIATTDTNLSSAWALRTSLQADETLGVRALTADSTLTGTTGRWTSLSSLDVGRTEASVSESKYTQISQSLLLNGGRFSAFSSAALSSNSVQMQGGPGDTNRGTLLVGGACTLGQGWRLSADVSESFGTEVQGTLGPQGGGAALHNLRTIHAGISQGGGLPGIIQRTLFFLSDRSFQQRIADEYAPGYVPSELAAEMSRRRFRQSGNFNFAGDLSHTQAEGSDAKADWVRLTGQVRVNTGWTFQVIGDWRKDEGLNLPGIRQDSKVVTVNGAYRFGVSMVTTNLGYSNNDLHAIQETDATNQVASLALSGTGAASRFLSVGFSSQFWLVPYGVMWSTYEDGWQAPTRAFSGNLGLNFRKVNLRITYQSVRRGDGLRNNAISLDLLRWFDTIAFRGF